MQKQAHTQINSTACDLPPEVVCIILRYVCNNNVKPGWTPRAITEENVNGLMPEMILSYDTIMVSRVSKEYHDLLIPTIKLASTIASVRIEYVLECVVAMTQDTDHSLKRVASPMEIFDVIYSSVFCFATRRTYPRLLLDPTLMEYGPDPPLCMNAFAMYYGLMDVKDAFLAQANTLLERQKMVNRIARHFVYIDCVLAVRFGLPRLRVALDA